MSTNLPLYSILTILLITTILVSVTLTDNSIKIIDDSDGFDLNMDTPNYTDYEDHNTYLSPSILFTARGLDGYYEFTKSFMDSILDPNFIKDDWIEVKQNSNNDHYIALTGKVTVNEVLRTYWVVVFVVVLLLFISLVVPIVGICFCCCRCCGNCGAKSKPSDKKKDFYYKCFEGSLIIAIIVLLLTFVLLAFTTNEQMHDGTDELPVNLRKSYGDAGLYLDSVEGQAENLLEKNYMQFSEAFRQSTNNSGESILQQLTIWQNASAMLEIHNFVTSIPNKTAELENLETLIGELKNDVTAVQNELDTIKSSLTNTLSGCSDQEQCKQIIGAISSIDININVDEIPSLDAVNNALNILNTDDIINAATSGKSKLDDLTKNINTYIEDGVNSANAKVEDAGSRINENMGNMTKIVKDIKMQVNNANSTLEDLNYYIKTYTPYFYYVGLALCCILLLVPLFLLLGVVWGVFCKRPGKQTGERCTKSSGSSFLIGGVSIIFITTIVLGILTCLMLIIGLAVDRGVCYPLKNPEKSSIVTYLDDLLSKSSNLNLNITNIFINCRNDDSLYNVFNISSRFDIDDLDTKFDIKGSVNDIVTKITNQLNNIIPEEFVILDNNEKLQLEQLVNNDVNIDFESFQALLDKQTFLTQDLNDMLQKLNNIATIYPSISEQLNIEIENIKKFQDVTLKKLQDTANKTLELARKLDTELKMNQSSFSEAMNKFLTEIEIAQKELVSNNKILVEAANNFGDMIISLVTSYKDRVVDVAKNKLGKCKPLQDAIDGTLIATCDKIILPWNGFWVALFMTLILFIPTLILSITLSSLYKKYKIEKLPKGDRASLRHDNRKYPYPEGRYPSDLRYNDMAPSNWILLHPDNATVNRRFTEYERPPPYYYFPGFYEL